MSHTLRRPFVDSRSFVASTAMGSWWLWLSLPIGALTAIAAAAGLFVAELYARDSVTMAVQATAQDFVTLVVAAPALIVSAGLAARGSRRAALIWRGVIAYLLYTYIIYAFDAMFNSLFLVYIAIVGCSLYALIGSLGGQDADHMQLRMHTRLVTPLISAFLIILAILFYALWLRDVIPALLAGRVPQTLLESRLPANPVHVLDMAIWLPGLFITGIGLRRQWPLAYILAPALLAQAALLGLAIVAMVYGMLRAGVSADAASALPMGLVTLLSLGLLAWYVRGVAD
jgi:hypothetical protein